jgi:hypothetical protein
MKAFVSWFGRRTLSRGRTPWVERTDSGVFKALKKYSSVQDSTSGLGVLGRNEKARKACAAHRSRLTFSTFL